MTNETLIKATDIQGKIRNTKTQLGYAQQNGNDKFIVGYTTGGGYLYRITVKPEILEACRLLVVASIEGELKELIDQFSKL